jgi:hypothetical protein
LPAGAKLRSPPEPFANPAVLATCGGGIHPGPIRNARRKSRGLTKKRDHLLDRAPEAALVRQTIILCFLGLMIFLVGGQIFFQPARSGLVAIFALALFGALLFVFLRGSLHLPSIGDRWGMSRLLGYEGDSPQELQNEIERLRAQMNQPDER